MAAAALGVAGWGANQFTPLSVVYRADEGWTKVTVVAMFTIYLVGLVPGLLLGCTVADRFGHRRVIRLALAATAASSLVLSLAKLSPDAVFCSRLVTGLAVGLIVSAGGAWLQALSPGGVRQARRRAVYATGAGFALGPLLAGVLTEWSSAPETLPPVVHAAATLAVFAGASRMPETTPSRPGSSRAQRPADRWSALTHARFVGVVLPASPAIFAAVTVAYVVLPPLVSDRVAGFAPLFSGFVAAVTISVGLAVQPMAARFDRPGSARATLLAMATVVVGLVVGAMAAERISPVLVVLAAALLGAGYGLTLESGLAEIDRLASPSALPTASALFQGVAHSGFLAPLVLALSSGAISYPRLLVILAALGLVFLAVAATYSRKHERAIQRSAAWDG